MSEQQRIDDLINRGTDLQTKFVYGMISIGLGTLALSFQFSTSNKLVPYLLVTSWLILFISILLGGWRVYILPSAFFANANMLQNKHEISQFKRTPIFKEDRTLWTQEEIDKAISRRQLVVDASLKDLNDIGSKAPVIFKCQVGFLILGELFLGAFTTINYMSSITN